MDTGLARPVVGRPSATTHARIETVAFGLFAERGFEETTLDAIAARVGVGRRTLFRYFASKNDIPWGRFDQTLVHFRDLLDAQPPGLSVLEAVGRAIVAFNDFPADAVPSHAARMELILCTPALRAHSALRYAEWRAVVADFVAARLGQEPTDLRPRLLGHVALGVALSAYEQWLACGADDRTRLLDLLRAAVADLVEAARSGEGVEAAAGQAIST